VNWHTTTAPNISYTLRATVRDAAGNTTTSTAVIVNVSHTISLPLPISNLAVTKG
jgi:hypothetical protein